MTFSFVISTISPVYTLSPAFLFPCSCLLRICTSLSIGSSPAFSASDRGIISRASAKAFAASCSLPLRVAEYSCSLSESSISGEPPPATILPSSITTPTTRSASCNPRSASSTTCSVPPCSTTETAFGFLQSVTKIMSSLASFFSSTTPASPRSFGDISSRLDTMFAPVALESLSISLFLIRRTANIPAFAR